MTNPLATIQKYVFALVLAASLASTSAAQGYSEKILHTFTGGPDGAYPSGTLMRDGAGDLYGTASGGGIYDWGVVFKIDTKGIQSVLYNFTGGADGGAPLGGVIEDSLGNLYGTAYAGSGPDPNGVYGTVFKLDIAGHLTVLHSFTYGADGAYPAGGLIRDSAGNLYGTTFLGGTHGAGVVFKLDTDGKVHVLHTFTGGNDGAYPTGRLVRDPMGSLYGTTDSGGNFYGGNGGVMFKIDRTGEGAHSFGWPGDGYEPNGDLIRDPDGNLYGTTIHGGRVPCYLICWSGTVFKVDASGHETVLYSFDWSNSGRYPSGGVVRDPAGNLYGATQQGGTSDNGAVFKLDPTGQETILYSFAGGADGASPSGSLIRDAAGNLYGTTHYGGNGYGVVFMLTPQRP